MPVVFDAFELFDALELFDAFELFDACVQSDALELFDAFVVFVEFLQPQSSHGQNLVQRSATSCKVCAFFFIACSPFS